MASCIDEIDFQRAFARILSEPEINQRFLKDPLKTGAELGLDAEQVAAIESVGLPRLHDFAENLASKRFGLIAKVCPATHALVERRGRLLELAKRFLRANPPHLSEQYSSRTIRDGYWFLEMLHQMDEEGALNDPLLADVARFERAMLLVSTDLAALESSQAFWDAAQERPDMSYDEMLASQPRLGLHTRIEAFQSDITEVIRALGSQQPLPELSSQPVIMLFSKQPGWRNISYAKINARTRELLERCDGISSCRQIIAGLLRDELVEKNAETFAERCFRILHNMAQINVLTFDHAPQPAGEASLGDSNRDGSAEPSQAPTSPGAQALLVQ